MEKKMYKRIGYYNNLDVVIMYDMSADDIVKNMHDGKGAFYHNDDDDYDGPVSEEDLRKYNNVKATTDGKYLITYDDCSDFDDTPLDIVNELADNRFIDIFEKI